MRQRPARSSPIIVIVATIGIAPADQKSTIFFASLIALAAGLSSTAIGVYGGVLVPGLLLLPGIDARFAAALSLFMQVLVIPLAAGSHYKMGNFSRKVALPLVIGGVIGAFIGPFFAAALPKEVIARLVAAMIVVRRRDRARHAQLQGPGHRSAPRTTCPTHASAASA